MFDGFGPVALGKVHPAEKQVCGGIVRLLLEHPFGTHGGTGAFTLKKEHSGDAQMGICLLRVQFEDAGETLMSIVQMQLLKAGAAVEKKQGDVVRRLFDGVADGLE